MNKVDLTTIILTREGFYYRKIREFNDELKSKDRKVFKNQLEEINRLKLYLLDESDVYKKYHKLKKKYSNLKANLTLTLK